jgi:hypothetical protein
MLDTDSVTSIKIVDGTIEGADIAANLDLSDSQKIRFGAGNDLEIFHDGATSYISNITGDLRLISDSNLILRSADQSENYLVATRNSDVELYFDGSKKFETTSTGATISGNLELSSTYPSLTWTDTNHNSDYRITNNDGQLIIYDITNSAHRLNVNADGNIQIPADNKYLQIGAGADLNFHHDGTHSYISNSTGTLHIMGKAGENSIQAQPDGKVELYYDNSKKFETAADRVNIYGHVFAIGGNYYLSNGFQDAYARFRNTGGSNDANFEFFVRDSGTETEALEITKDAHIRIPNDNKKLKFGAGDDLQIYHDGTHSYLYNLTGELKNRAAIWKVVNAANSEIQIKATENAAVELYYDHSKKFETTSYGNASAGQVRVTSSNASTVAFSCGDVGTGFYNSGSNAIGYSTNGSQKWNVGGGGHISLLDNVQLRLGTDADLSLYHDGSKNVIADTGTGGLFIGGSSISLTNSGISETMLYAVPDGAVELYYNNSKKFETTSSGIDVSGAIGQTDLRVLADNANLSFYLTSPSDWRFRTTSGAERIRIQSGGGISFNGDTAAANALDDYEEGTWTPNIRNNGATATWTTQQGRYVKIGQQVTVWFNADGGTAPRSGGGSGELIMTGLPFSQSIFGNPILGIIGANNNVSSGLYSTVGLILNIFGQGGTQVRLGVGGQSANFGINYAAGSFTYTAA